MCAALKLACTSFQSTPRSGSLDYLRDVRRAAILFAADVFTDCVSKSLKQRIRRKAAICVSNVRHGTLFVCNSDLVNTCG
jgi:hypothetical protein